MWPFKKKQEQRKKPNPYVKPPSKSDDAPVYQSYLYTDSGSWSSHDSGSSHCDSGSSHDGGGGHDGGSCGGDGGGF